MTHRAINFRQLDSLRGFLAVYVLIGHARWLLWQGHAAWAASTYQSWEVVPVYLSAVFRYGREAVMVFFVLSGFFIHYRAAGNASHQFKTGMFYRRRWDRLGAPYYLALTVTVICDAIGRTWWAELYDARTGDALLDSTFIRTGFDREATVPALLLLPSSLGRDFGSNGPLWSLAYEVVYYALYPAWLLIRQRNRLVAFVVVPAACVLLTFAPAGGFAAAAMAHYPIWLAGAFVAEWVRTHGVDRRLGALGAASFAGGAAVHLTVDVLAISIAAAMLYGTGAVLMFGAWRGRHPASDLGEFLGLRSYTIYIVHFPVLALISAFVIHQYGGRPAHGWLAVAGVLAAIAVALVCFEICERRVLHARYGDQSAAP